MPTLHPLQIAFILFTFCGPPLLWLIGRRWPSPAYRRAVRCTLAVAIVVAYFTALALNIHSKGGFLADEHLPFHLCSWAAVAVVAALFWRARTAFELAYCWGIAGTAQALFTPAIKIDYNPETICFLIVHSFIPASVLWLILGEKFRPRPGAFLRVLLWSEIYLVVTLLVNRAVHADYGFLTEPPPQASLLDHFSTTQWIYVAQINLTGIVAFALLLLPWWVVSRVRERKI
jgi:hypothetical integral membrane protein (TIGR02206 family)